MENIKSILYQKIKSVILSLLVEGTSDPLFKFAGHYNSPDIDNENNFAYDTPAAFIALDSIVWDVTKHDTPESDITREQSGTIQFSVHLFFHDLRTDSDSFVDHLDIIEKVYYNILGIRSDESVKGKIGTIKRISERDDITFENLRHWITTFETPVQQTGIKHGKVDAQPITFVITKEIKP